MKTRNKRLEDLVLKSERMRRSPIAPEWLLLQVEFGRIISMKCVSE